MQSEQTEAHKTINNSSAPSVVDRWKARKWAILCPAVHESKRHDAVRRIPGPLHVQHRGPPPAFLLVLFLDFISTSLCPPSYPSFPFCNTLLLPSLVSSIISRRASEKSLDIARPTLLAFGESTTSARPPEPVQASPVFSRPTQTNTTYTPYHHLACGTRPPLEAAHHLASQLFLTILPPTLIEARSYLCRRRRCHSFYASSEVHFTKSSCPAL